MSFNAIGSKNTVELFRYFGNPLRELFQSRHFVRHLLRQQQATEIAFIIICKSYNSSQPFRRQLRICRRGGGSRASHKRQSPFTNFYFTPTDDWSNLTGRFKSQPELIFIMPHFACTNNRVQNWVGAIKYQNYAELKF